MKRIFFCAVLLTAFALLLAACTTTGDTDVIDGGVRDNSNYDAPKTIISTEPVAFTCTFSTLTHLYEDEEDPMPPPGVYTLSATLEGNSVTGSYDYYLPGEESRQESFTADAAFMAELQDIISRYDLPQYNGTSIFVSGLPEMFGAELQISYASGETVSASDNQYNFLSDDAICALEELFRTQLP